MPQAVGSSRLWSGVILIVLGVLFLLDRLHLIRFGEFLETWWPSVFILLGLWQISTRRYLRIGGPLFWILLGVLLQVSKLELFPWWDFGQLWPVLLIFVGVWLLVSRLSASACAVTLAGADSKQDSGEVVDAFAFWSGVKRAVNTKGFRGGEATAVMGGIELDLRGAELAPGEQRLNLTAIMGGIEVRVPTHWPVSVQGTPLMGGIEDKRQPSSPAPDSAAGGRLTIHAFALFGGIEVRT